MSRVIMEPITEIIDPVNLEEDEINWDVIRDMTRQIKDTEMKDTEMKKLFCKKCDAVFYCKNYHGKFPLCEKHRHNTFKKQ